MPDKRTIFASVMVGVFIIGCNFAWQYGPEFFSINDGVVSILMSRIIFTFIAIIAISSLAAFTEIIFGWE